jgi:hypothetical protein
MMMPKEKPTTGKIANACSAKSSENTEKPEDLEAKLEAIEVFFDVLKALLNRELGDNPNPQEIKIATYIAKYIQGLLVNALMYWREYNRIPVLQYSIFSDHKGRSIMDLYVTPDTQTYENFKLKSLCLKLKAATDVWDLELDQSDVQLPKLTEMSQKEINTLEAYSIIQQYIKDQSDEPEGS